MSSTVCGNAAWETCWREAAYLAKYIYKDPPGAEGFHTYYPAYMQQAERNWEVWDEENNQQGSGLVARLYKLRSWDPGLQSPSCPPCLVFRGTDFEDMRDLAINVRIKVRWGIIWKNFEFTHVADGGMKKIVERKRRGGRSGPVRQVEVDYTREELVNMGFTSVPILSESGQVRVEGATRGTQLNLNIRLEADLLLRDDGDWLNNILQGLGRGAPQYDEAMIFAELCTENRIEPLEDKRLQISGHSLGGGLAAAICCHLDSLFPEISFHAVTFNAAGVHPNTVHPAALTDGKTDNFTVRDELLTTLQSYENQVPLIGAVFKHAERALGMSTMPDAVGTTQRIDGCSPGGDLGPQGVALPILFPVSEQTLVPGAPSDLPVLSRLDAMLMNAVTIPLFGARFIEHLNARYRDVVMAEDRPWTIVGIYEGMFDRFMTEIEPELGLLKDVMEAAAHYHGMDTVIATYDSMFGGGG